MERESRSLEHYEKGARVIAVLSEGFRGEAVPEDMFKSWKDTMSAMRHSDDIIDNSTDIEARKRIAQDALAYLSGSKDEINFPNTELNNSLTVLRAHLSEVDVRRQDIFFRSVKNVLKIGEKIRTTTDIGNFTKLRKIEGQISSRLLLAFDDSVNPEYIKMISKLTRIANIVDSAIDLPRDYENGNCKIRPTVLNRARILMSAGRDGVNLCKMLFDKRVNCFPLLKSAWYVLQGKDR